MVVVVVAVAVAVEVAKVGVEVVEEATAPEDTSCVLAPSG